jgi:hypothetical protein
MTNLVNATLASYGPCHAGARSFYHTVEHGMIAKQLPLPQLINILRQIQIDPVSGPSIPMGF